MGGEKHDERGCRTVTLVCESAKKERTISEANFVPRRRQVDARLYGAQRAGASARIGIVADKGVDVDLCSTER